MIKVQNDDSSPALVEVALSRLFLFTVIMSEDMKRGLDERGLTRARASALWEISHRDSITQRELADALKVTPRNVTTLIDALEKTGFVKRTDHPSDRRAILLQLTLAGQTVTDRLKSETREFAGVLFEGVDPLRLQQFMETLDLVIGRLEHIAATTR